MSSTPNSTLDPATDTGKERAQRIPLDYYKQKSYYDRLRWWLSLGALLLIGDYVTWIFGTSRGALQFSTGRISTPHAAFEHNCKACHTDFSPLASDAWTFDPQRSAELTAQACKDCHKVTSHHFERLSPIGQIGDQKCTNCHSEHLGREHSLISASDVGCVQCHADLQKFRSLNHSHHTRDGIDEFTVDSHGDFPSIAGPDATDPGTVRFNHALHMMPGQVKDGMRGGMTLGRISKEYRDRYDRAAAGELDALVQLDCDSCHTFGSPSGTDARLGDLVTGEYANPISYDQHCAACHQLSIIGQSAEEAPVQHGVLPSRLKNSILRRLLANSVDPSRKTLEKNNHDMLPVSPVRILGESNSGNSSVALNAIDYRAELLVEQLNRQCLYCHDQQVLSAQPSSASIPTRWMFAGFFDHQSHQGVTCLFCHPQADPDMRTIQQTQRDALQKWLNPQTQMVTAGTGASDSAAALDHERIMISGIVTCVPCHRSGDDLTTSLISQSAIDGSKDSSLTAEDYELLFTTTLSRAPANCTSCHQYHWSRTTESEAK